ncbi:MAG: prepilin-type N-terminal cleavage/methylation domain-containing protein [Proteobacteria bacterium]|nr:prepilin-type N-terminal cleavage/methylation domain-containing protein [Pseudomonadota bacterium]
MSRPERQSRRSRGARATSAESSGFTLVEVMVALAILALALTVVAEAQQAGMRRTLRAQFVTTATMLAREKMIDVEERLYEKGFSQFEEEQEGDFEGEGLERFRYRVTIDKVELPSGLDAQALAGALGGREGSEGSAGGAGGATAIGGQLLGGQLELFRTVLEQSIRRVSLQVLWREGRSEQQVQVDAYFTDPSLVGGGAMGGLAAPADSAARGPGVAR